MEHAIEEILDLFDKNQQELCFWLGDMEKNGWCEGSAIAAAQYWGHMCGLAAAAKELGNSELKDRIGSMSPRFYKGEYPTQ